LRCFGNPLSIHNNPLRVAEEIAMLDLISGGRIISQLGCCEAPQNRPRL